MPGSSGKKVLAAALLLLVAAGGALAFAAGALDAGLAIVLAVQVLVLLACAGVYAHSRHVERVVLRSERRTRKELAQLQDAGRTLADDVRTAAAVGVQEHVDAAAGALLTAVGEERADRVLRSAELEERLGALRTDVSASLVELGAASARREQELRADVREVAELTAQARRSVDEARLAADKARRVEFRQLESLVDLHSALRPRAPMPATRGWAASPDVLVTLVRQVLELRPALVVDCGSGLSTLWIAYALERVGAGGRVVALEHDQHYAGETHGLLASHGLLDTAEVRHAPLHPLHVDDGEQWCWYSPSAVDDLQGIGLVFVDGPPESVQELARYPAVPMLLARCTSDVRLVLDDAHREGERRSVERWTSEHGLVARELRDHEKGCCVLSRRP